jgi:hypothetical protein
LPYSVTRKCGFVNVLGWCCKVSAVDDTNVNGCNSDNQDSVIAAGPTCMLDAWGVVLNSWQEQDTGYFSSSVCPDWL